MTSEYTYSPVPGTPFAMTAEQVAYWFCEVHRSWWRDQKNSLCGRRQACFNALVAYLKTGATPEVLEEIYVVGKFASECESWFEKKG